MHINPFIYDKPLKCIKTLCIEREQLLNEIIREVMRGSYYSILSPRYSGKTTFLYQIKKEIEKRQQFICIYIDLENFRSLDLDNLYHQLYKRIIASLKLKEDNFLEFRNSISLLLKNLPDKNLILILDNIELIYDYLAKELLKTLRAIFMERGIRKEFNRFRVIIAGAIELFELSIGKGSPFSIARHITLPEFDHQESELLIKQGMEKAKVIIKEEAKEMLIKKTNGQPYLLQKLCYMAIERIRLKNRNTITPEDIKELIEDYIKIGIRDKVFKSMVKKIKEYPELLETLVDIMEGRKPKLQQVSIEIGRLELTGAIIINDNEYLIRNEIYERVLKNYFNYAKLGDFFTIAGRYNKAIEYFEKLDKENKKLQINNVFLSLFNLMYTSYDLERIYDLILKGLYTFLGFDDVRIWILNKEGGYLECKRMITEKVKGIKIPISQERGSFYELKVLNEKKIIIDNSELTKLALGIPLISQTGNMLGIIGAIRFTQDKKEGIKEVEVDLLKSFAYQSTIAIENAMQFKERKELTQNLKGLYRTANQISSSVSKPEAIFQKIVDTVGSLLNAEVCYIGLKEKNGWEIKASYREKRLEGKKYNKGITKKVIETGEFLKAEWVKNWGEVEYKGVQFTNWRRANEKGLKACIIAPLKVGEDKAMGVISVYLSNREYFLEREITLLKILANQIAVAIENAKKFREIQDMERALIQLEKMSELGLFAGGIAHEIRNPLWNIKNALKLIEMKANTDELYKYVKIADENITRASNIIQDLLYFSKSARLEMNLLDLNQLIKLTLTLIEKQIKRDNIEVKTELSHKLPQVMANENGLKLVIINLIKNAIQAMPEGGKLGIRTEYNDGMVQFSVSDTGVGISPEDKEKIFAPYFSTKPDGRGFGLSLAHKIIEKHQGRIEVKSKLGEGTTFVVSLPIERSN